ncbi:hypothetical protein HPP92_018356 [Vanilla planifolia]|uniref:Uncharacterized protein n=1 Tax=Vanilla planifolia TaxID=51239 RepID=A0A835QDX9_VANPL|nr:hypothetical protein HPP92_018967 [Vanilla planifolia]KAG0469028.1 hypothetical protein HPP92_018356 [Vanilla planifolia]
MVNGEGVLDNVEMEVELIIKHNGPQSTAHPSSIQEKSSCQPDDTVKTLVIKQVPFAPLGQPSNLHLLGIRTTDLAIVEQPWLWDDNGRLNDVKESWEDEDDEVTKIPLALACLASCSLHRTAPGSWSRELSPPCLEVEVGLDEAAVDVAAAEAAWRAMCPVAFP